MTQAATGILKSGERDRDSPAARFSVALAANLKHLGYDASAIFWDRWDSFITSAIRNAVTDTKNVKYADAANWLGMNTAKLHSRLREGEIV